MRRPPCPIEPLTRCVRCIDPRWLRTSASMTCWHSSSRCRPGETNSAARAAPVAPARRTICLAFAMAARAMAIRSVAPSLAGGRILPMIPWSSQSDSKPLRSGKRRSDRGVKAKVYFAAGAIRRRPGCATRTSSTRPAAFVCVLRQYVHLRTQ